METGRQTDKATHWKTAVFEIDDNWSKLETLPMFVKEVHKQKEVCPTTNKEHYQIHVVCHRQVRLTSLTGWIKKTKWFAVLGAEHIANSIAYCSKKESAVEGTQQVVKGEAYHRIHDLLLIIGRAYFHIRPEKLGLTEWEEEFDAHLFKNASRHLVQQNINWINKICNPVVEKMWNLFHREILEIVREEEGAFIIEAPDAIVPKGQWLGGEDEVRTLRELRDQARTKS